MYIGEFKNDLPHGKGVYTYEDGSYYKGMFTNGVRQGEKGKYTWKDTTILKGEWKDGKNVKGKLINPSGNERQVPLN